MALKPSSAQRSLFSRVRLREDQPWWRVVLDRSLWVVMTLVVVSLLSQALGWPLLGPYKPFLEALRLDRDAHDSTHEGRIRDAVVTSLQLEDRSTREALIADIATLREENLRLKADLLSLRHVKGGEAGFKLSDLKVTPTKDLQTFHWQLRVLSAAPELTTFKGSIQIRLRYPSGEEVLVSSSDRHPADTEGTLSLAYTQTLHGVFKNTKEVKPSKVTAELWKNGDRTPLASISTPL